VNRKTIFAFVAAVFLIAQMGAAKGPIGTLSGTVVDSHGRPVASATITMQTSVGSRAYARHSDPNGHFEFLRFEPGQYDLRAYAQGSFSDWLRRISIHANKTTEVTLHMPPLADETVKVPQR
jgi:hypothetical protein